MRTVGIDEVGRGCLAGPVVAVAVLLPEGFSDPRVTDSKKVPEKQRDQLAAYLRETAVGYGIGVVCNRLVDEVNILRATKQAMHLALSRLHHSFDNIIVDAVKLNNVGVPLSHPYKADLDHVEVSAASIIAKAYRDAMMRKLHIEWPEYGWYKNKGYGSKEHTDAIRRLGLSPLHRTTFCGSFV